MVVITLKKALLIKQQGAVLVLFALFLTVIASLVALVIDGSLIYLSSEQSQYHARLAALAAIEEYYDHKDCGGQSCSHEERMNAALERAQEVSNTNILSAQSSATANFSTQDLENSAFLEAGRWENSVEKCQNFDAKAPCFLSLARLGSSYQPNAFRVSGTFYSGVATKLAKGILGMENFATKVFATASVTPRRTCFLIDISNSTTYQTHKNGARFAYSLGDGGVVVADQLASWNSLPTTRFADTPTDPTVHYQSDYKKMQILDDSFYPSMPSDVTTHHPNPLTEGNGMYSQTPMTGSGTWALVDTFRDTNSDGGTYYGPEPLRTIFVGLRQAINIFKDRSVAGDKACLIFYDHNLYWPRIVKMTDNFDYLLKQTDFDNWSTINDSDSEQVPGAIYNISQSSGLDRVIRFGLFPSESTFTDTYSAMTEALNQFSKTDATTTDSNVPSANSMILIGDGLTNCSHSSASCNNSYETHSQNINEVLTMAKTNLVPNSIAVHVILVGDNVRPHTVNRPSVSNPGKCMTDREYRARYQNHQNISGFVRGNVCWDLENFEDEEDSSYADGPCPDVAYYEPPYYEINKYMYELAAITQGIWAPLRPPPSGCAVDGGDYEAPCTEGERQETDPACRSMQTQIKQYMTDILGENPYTLVELSRQ